MGSDQLVETLIGTADDDLTAAHADYYAPRLRQLRPFEDAGELLRRTSKAGYDVVLATSASAKEAPHLRAAIGADDVITHMSTSDDADTAKPEPDILQTSLAAVGAKAEDAVFIGDTVWDIEACKRAGIPCIALLSGGITARELTAAGAAAVYADAAELLQGFDESLLGKRAGRADDEMKEVPS
jgi:HAD superfamily hydrolase (TIGR01509 family)